MKDRSRTHAIYLLMGMVIVIIGGMLNMMVLIKNDARMPVQTKYPYEIDTHFGFNTPDEVNLYYLTDIIKIGGWYISVGDIFMLIGLVTALKHVIMFFYSELSLGVKTEIRGVKNKQ